MKTLLSVAVLLALAVSLQAAPIACVDGSSATVFGADGCYSGDKLFTNFTSSVGAVVVSFFEAGNVHTISLAPSGGGTWTTSGMTLGYTISMYGAAPTWGIIGANVDSTVAGLGETNVAKTLSYSGGPSTINSVGGGLDSVSLRTQRINVSMVLTINAGSGIQSVSDTYTQGTVPEPMTMALMGGGLLALGLVRRFRR